MVHQLRHHNRLGRTLVISALAGGLLLGSVPGARADGSARNGSSVAKTYLGNARYLFHKGQYFRAARYAFAAIGKDPGVKPQAYSWVSLSLSKAHLYNSASYFLIKTLQSGDRSAIRRALTQTQNLLVYVGPDLLRKYLILHTKYEDYNASNLNAYLYALGKDALLADHEDRAIGYLNGIRDSSPLWPFALQLKASAEAIKGESERAVADFQRCVDDSDQVTEGVESGTSEYQRLESQGEDLQARCMAGVARSYYQEDKFDEADRAYDRIQKSSLVWPDILFEQAWNAFARHEYNRALGKLVSYKSPALQFVFNPEIDVLRAQSYLALCLYSDANEVINEFNGRYTHIGELVKHFVESKNRNLEAFYEVGKQALHRSIYSEQGFDPMLNQFIRGPYFVNLVRSEQDIDSELQGVRRFGIINMGGRVSHEDPGRGFPGFLAQVLAWRKKSVHILGGMFVKNSLIDYHSELISDFEKMAFIKLEMLKRAKEQLLDMDSPEALRLAGPRSVGDVRPDRKDYQYYWSFNGEFWADELGDYVFGLESQCGKKGGSG